MRWSFLTVGAVLIGACATSDPGPLSDAGERRTGAVSADSSMPAAIAASETPHDGCTVDGDCGPGSTCIQGLCIGAGGNAEAKSGQFNTETCWLPYESRVMPALAVHGGGCLTLDEAVAACKAHDAIACLGAGRLSELADMRESGLQYYRAACRKKIAEGCRRAGVNDEDY